MMSGIGSKRPPDADAGNNAPAPASAKRPKKSAEVLEDQQDASWSTVMTPELIGTVARFLDLGTPSRPDLTNLCLAVGNVTSRVVRKMYLSGNEWYLSHLCRVAYDTGQHTRQAGMESWLEYNPDWRNRCVGAKSEKNVYSITLDQDVVKDLHFSRNYSRWFLDGGEDEDNFVSYDKPKNVPVGLEFGVGDAVLSVGGFDVAGMMAGAFYKLLRSGNVVQDGKIVLEYLPASIRLFSDPLVAAKYDFFAPFKHIIETGAVGVNEAYMYDEFYSNDKVNLIWFTLGPLNISGTCKCFEYLLAVEGTNVNIEDPYGDVGQRLIHFLAQSNGSVAFEALRLLTDSHKRTGLDLNAQDEDGWTAIHYMFSLLDTRHHKTKMSQLKLLLEAGADPNLPDANGETPEQFLLKSPNKYLSNTWLEPEVDEAIGMLRRYTLMREAE